MYYPRFTKVIIHHFIIQEKSLSWRNIIGMHTSKDDYLINTLRFVSRIEASHKYGVVLPECLTKSLLWKQSQKERKKEKVDVAHGKGIELLSEVAISEKYQIKEARKKSLRDFHKTHPSSFGTVAEKPPSVEKITPTVTSEGTDDKLGVPDVTNDDSSESESESWGNDEDDSNNEQESSDESSKQENESEEQELDSEQDEESEDDDQKEEETD
ncbi:hypothetical protein Tco_0892228 [Tanacetum coccineum]|uniref:Uncharacterized protein n=1 Tax=Tanacetum coccineum TaxID=301880 RepID=A0ABQ5C8H0_9ASTR